MRKINYYLLIITCFLGSCSPGQNNRFIKEQNLKDEFKNYLFCQCLIKGFNRKNTLVSLIRNDNSTMSDFPLGLENYKFIDSLTTILNQQMIGDSLALVNEFNFKSEEEIIRAKSNGLIGKRVIYNCLKFYNSEKLDSMLSKKLDFQ